MPLYDIRCQQCDGIFETKLNISELNSQIECKYCQQKTLAEPMLTGRVQFRTLNKWKPQNKAQQLAGAGAAGPGIEKNAARNSVLHNCKGMNCSVCGV